jgi:hypothetical protein
MASVIVGNRYALTLRRRTQDRLVYSNEVVERALGVRATTRGWETLLTVCTLLDN